MKLNRTREEWAKIKVDGRSYYQREQMALEDLAALFAEVERLRAQLEAERALSDRLATELGIIDRALACEEADANAEQDMDGNVYAKINVTTFRNTTRAALTAHTAAREEPHDKG